jgi:hypothetical protein
MKDLLSILLGFFFTVTILMILFDNCSFSVGCGGKYASRRYEHMSSYPLYPAEHFTEYLKEVDEQKMDEIYPSPEPEPDVNDEQYAVVESEKTEVSPVGAPFQGDGVTYSNTGGKPFNFSVM